MGGRFANGSLVKAPSPLIRWIRACLQSRAWLKGQPLNGCFFEGPSLFISRILTPLRQFARWLLSSGWVATSPLGAKPEEDKDGSSYANTS